MKKIFTLLFCLTAMSLACNAYDLTTVNQCFDVMLTHNADNQMLASPNLDANHDGVINIHDVTCMIDEMLRAQQVERASNRASASNDNVNIEKLMKEVLESETETPNIDDVTDAVNKKLRNE